METHTNNKIKLRPFDDLIKTIEIDGEVFCPIEEIAKLAICVGEVKNVKTFALKGCDAIFYGETSFSNSGIKIIINTEFDIELYDEYGISKNYNQVQIVKNLIKWGFIEP